jgi:hypothetical protein
MSRTLTVVAAALFALGGPGLAAAHHKSDPAGGPPTSEATVVTEDADNDGTPNAPDPLGDADNRHPSGKDKHEESGGSGNQGNAASEPDANGNGPERDAGGLDQPGGPGGMDVLDQDGNNGCGNDDDFEDDNEGWCGKPSEAGPGVVTPPEVEETVTPPAVSPPGAGTVSGEVAGEVLGEVLEGESSPPAGVLGEVEAAGVAGAGAVGSLAFTGAEVWPLATIALGLAMAGAALITMGRRRSER